MGNCIVQVQLLLQLLRAKFVEILAVGPPAGVGGRPHEPDRRRPMGEARDAGPRRLVGRDAALAHLGEELKGLLAHAVAPEAVAVPVAPAPPCARRRP